VVPSSLLVPQDTLRPLDPILRFVATQSSRRRTEVYHLRALWCNGLHAGYILLSKAYIQGRSSNLRRTAILFSCGAHLWFCEPWPSLYRLGGANGKAITMRSSKLITRDLEATAIEPAPRGTIHAQAWLLGTSFMGKRNGSQPIFGPRRKPLSEDTQLCPCFATLRPRLRTRKNCKSGIIRPRDQHSY
jgi:hypothetical protein